MLISIVNGTQDEYLNRSHHSEYVYRQQNIESFSSSGDEIILEKKGGDFRVFKCSSPERARRNIAFIFEKLESDQKFGIIVFLSE